MDRSGPPPGLPWCLSEPLAIGCGEAGQVASGWYLALLPPGGLVVMSCTTRFTPSTSLMIRVAAMAARSKARACTGSAGLLDAATGPEDVLLREHRPHDLQPDRQTLDKTARHRGRGLAREIERPRQRRPVEPLGEARDVGRIDASCESGDGNGRRQQ